MLDDLILAVDVLETNALLIDHAIAYAQWLAPGLAAASVWWVGYRAMCRIQDRRRARRAARAKARRIARETALLHHVGQHLTDVIAADAELNRRIQHLRDTRKENDQP